MQQELKTKFKKYLNAQLVEKKLVKGHSSYQKFIVLGRHRVGSNMLLSVLNQHSNLHCFSEPFSESAIIFGSRIYGKPVEKNERLIAFRDNGPVPFLEKYIWKTVHKNIDLLGFKIFYPQLEYPPFHALSSYFKQALDIKVIHLKRENLLDLFISTKLARLNKVMIISNDKERKSYEENSKLNVAPEEVELFFNQVEKEYAKYSLLFKNHNCLEVSYQNLISNAVFEYKRVFSFLGIDPEKKDYTPQTRKQNQKDYPSVFGNWDILKNYFQKSKWADLF